MITSLFLFPALRAGAVMVARGRSPGSVDAVPEAGDDASAGAVDADASEWLPLSRQMGCAPARLEFLAIASLRCTPHCMPHCRLSASAPSFKLSSNSIAADASVNFAWLDPQLCVKNQLRAIGCSVAPGAKVQKAAGDPPDQAASQQVQSRRDSLLCTRMDTRTFLWVMQPQLKSNAPAARRIPVRWQGWHATTGARP